MYKNQLYLWYNIVSVCVNTMCLSQLSLSEVTGSEKNLIAQLVSQLSLSEIMVQGRTDIGQLNYRLVRMWFRENHGDFITGSGLNTWCYLPQIKTISILHHAKLKSYMLHSSFEWDFFLLVINISSSEMLLLCLPTYYSTVFSVTLCVDARCNPMVVDSGGSRTHNLLMKSWGV